MKKRFNSIPTVLIIAVLLNLYSCKKSANDTKTYFVNYSELDSKREKIENGDEKETLSFENLIIRADSLVHGSLFSVVNKKGIPPSGDKHDYMSIGPYWWPNPEIPEGRPYIRRDGEINPETRNNYTDYVEGYDFFRAINDLTYAYYLGSNKVYAKRAIEFLNAWFLNEKTKMNPNLNYAQSIPGKNEGRCFGIIEFGGIGNVLKCLELLEHKKILDKETKIGMKQWLTDYAFWLQNSKLGIEESTRENNHGTHYDIQLLNILLYLNKKNEVKEYLSTVTKARIFQQIEPDGSQPRELARTKSFSYTVMNLHGFMELVRLGKKVEVDLWGFESEDGRSIKKAFQYMLPYLAKEKEWEYKQIVGITHSEEKLFSDIRYIHKTFNERSFEDVLKINSAK